MVTDNFKLLSHLNIPRALTILEIVSRLASPQEVSWGVIRTLLHGLTRQLDTSILANTATAHELRRTSLTKEMVVTFDRFAFDQSGVHAEPILKTDSAAGIFGDEITSSLSALAQDFSLWGVILLDALD